MCTFDSILKLTLAVMKMNRNSSSNIPNPFLGRPSVDSRLAEILFSGQTNKEVYGDDQPLLAPWCRIVYVVISV